jgi:1-aminocyclopropane-1-carboxylate deaminase
LNGVSLANVSVLRLDQMGGFASGNKSFKLRPYLELAKSSGVGRLLSFGGPWSNHLHALAALGAQLDIATIGLVRGEEHEADTPMLEDARGWGMQIVRISRTEYRQRNDAEYLSAMESRFAPCIVIPEGGASLVSALSCKDIAADLLTQNTEARKIVLAIGTGTTMAGIVAGLNPDWNVRGISALKGANDLESRVEILLDQAMPGQHANWSIDHRFHCGGFARASPELREFVLEFEATQGIGLDPVYTAKAMFALYQMRSTGEMGGQDRAIMIHTGGMQGRRGRDWMPSLAT